MRWDGEARNLSREERKMTAIMRQSEEMEQMDGCAEREVGRGARSLKTRERKRPRTSRVASKARQLEEEAAKKRKHPSSEEDNEAQKQQREEGVGGR